MLNSLLRPGHKTQVVIQELLADSEQLEQETEALAVRVAKLQKENGYLRKLNKVKPHIRLIVRAEAAAQMLALWHCAGFLTGRDACYGMGMKHLAWYAGRALLTVARLWDDKGWVTDDPETIERQLRVAVERCKQRPDLLGYRIPQQHRPKAFRP